MKYVMAALVGIDKINDKIAYRTIVATCERDQSGTCNWEFKPKIISREELVNSIRNKLKWLNVGVKNGRIQGTAGSLDRFFDIKTGSRPLVIIAETRNSDGKTIGYIVSDYNGMVKRISIKQMLDYGRQCTNRAGIPVQNAMFVGETEKASAHYRSFPEHEFFIEVINISKNVHSDKRRIEINKNKKALASIEMIYTPEQIEQLKLGKKNGVEIKIYANPKLSAEQMKVLRKGLQRHINVRPFAFPEYTVDVMEFYITELECKMDIREYTSAKYSLAQLGELSLAVEEGLDISKMSDPKLSAKKMGEIRERMKAGIFREMEVDGKMRMVI